MKIRVLKKMSGTESDKGADPRRKLRNEMLDD
jgi:hypothetical protein